MMGMAPMRMPSPESLSGPGRARSITAQDIMHIIHILLLLFLKSII
jgi:hypothetical protein